MSEFSDHGNRFVTLGYDTITHLIQSMIQILSSIRTITVSNNVVQKNEHPTFDIYQFPVR